MDFRIEERDKRILELIEAKKEDKILVIGTGIYPRIEKMLSDKGIKNITSIDIEEKNIQNGRRQVPKVKFKKMDAQKEFDLSKGSFDIVIMTEVLEHLKDQYFTLKEIKEVLKKGGRLILTVPKRRWYNIFSPITHLQHYREYNERGIKNVLNQSGFNVKKIFVGGTIFNILNLWYHLFCKYIFKKIDLVGVFQREIDKSWEKNYIGKGNDLLVLATNS